MALEYTLNLKTDVSKEQIHDVLATSELLTFDKDGDCFVGVEIYVKVSLPSETHKIIIDEIYHFAPTVYVYMRTGKNELYEQGKSNMVAITSLLLKNISGNAVLTFNDEYVYLAREGDEVFLQGDDPLTWTEEMIERLSVPYTKKNLERII